MSLPRAARHSSGAANHTPNAEFPLRGHEPSICVGTSELRAMSIIRQRQRLRPGLVRLLHRAGTITIILSSCCAKNKRNNNKRLSLQSCNDRHNPELLLRRKAHGYHDHRHLDLVLGSRSTPARLGLQALEREYSCCRNQYLRNDYMFRAHLFRFQYRRGGYSVSSTIWSKVRDPLADHQKSTTRTALYFRVYTTGWSETAIIAAALLLLVE